MLIFHVAVDGGFTDWGDWTKCSVKCGGGGVQTSNRSCTNPKPRFKGKDCEGPTKRSRACGMQPCPGEESCLVETLVVE